MWGTTCETIRAPQISALADVLKEHQPDAINVTAMRFCRRQIWAIRMIQSHKMTPAHSRQIHFKGQREPKADFRCCATDAYPSALCVLHGLTTRNRQLEKDFARQNAAAALCEILSTCQLSGVATCVSHMITSRQNSAKRGKCAANPQATVTNPHAEP